jgi:hypothetical protein
MSRPKHLTQLFTDQSLNRRIVVCAGPQARQTIASHNVSLQLTGTALCAPKKIGSRSVSDTRSDSVRGTVDGWWGWWWRNLSHQVSEEM